MPEMARADLGVVDTAVRGLRRPGRRPDGTGLRVSTSRSAVLRLLGALSEPEVPSPRVVGVDEYATRKGRVYGTVLVDVETRRPVDRCLTGRRQAWLHGCRSDLGSRSSAGTARRSSLKAPRPGRPRLSRSLTGGICGTTLARYRSSLRRRWTVHGGATGSPTVSGPGTPPSRRCHPGSAIYVATRDINLQRKLAAVGLPFTEAP